MLSQSTQNDDFIKEKILFDSSLKHLIKIRLPESLILLFQIHKMSSLRAVHSIKLLKLI